MLGGHTLACLVALGVFASAAAPPACAQVARSYSVVDDARLASPEPRNWLMVRGTYNGWGYSPLDQINTENVAELTPVWTLSTGVREGHQSPPIVNDGVMFITTPGSQVYALDAKTGDVLWLYARPLPFDLQQLHPTNRGVALFGDKVYVATVDAFLVALDAATGELAWQVPVEDYRHGYYMTLAPLAARGNIMVGVSGGETGVRGFIAAFDAETGAEAWRTYTVPGPGEFGGDTWPEGAWKTGGVPVWVTGSYDPELDIAYWGTGNGGPWTGDARPGDSLYANSVLAIDIATGAIEDYHQYHWNGSWDWDEVSTPLLLDVERDGRPIKGLVHAGRNGYLWLLERTGRGIDFVAAEPFVFQNVFTSLDPETGRPEYDLARKPRIGYTASFCPSVWGGKTWPSEAYSPATGLLYIPANENLCSTITGEEAEYEAGRRFTGARTELEFTERMQDHVGELQAWDMNRGERVWTHEFEGANWGPVLATGGGLVFAGGTSDRYFRAFDAETGKLLWRQRTNSGITGVPSTYEVDGVQYVAVQSGWGVSAARMQLAIDGARGMSTVVPQGGVLWVFALRGLSP